MLGAMGATVAPVARRPNPTVVGIAVWLASEVMFFGGLFAAYFSLRATNDAWPPDGIHIHTFRALVFTLILVASSITLHQAERGAMRLWTLVSLGLGVVFIANQALEWSTNDFSVSTNAYGTIYYVMTGVHGLHVIVGLVLLAIVGLGLGETMAGMTRATTWYWHFVDVVWILLFTVIFIVR